jgi:hemoglobin-like flavoprotein
MAPTPPGSGQPGSAGQPTTAPVEEKITGFLNNAKATFDKMISDEFADLVKSIGTDFDALEKSSLGITKNLGRSSEFAFGMRQTFADALPLVAKLGGTIADIGKIQESVISSTGRGVQLAAEDFKKMFAVSKVIGQDTSDIFTSFKNIGVSINEAGKETDKLIQTVSQFGVDIDRTFSQIMSNMKYINYYNFEGGVEGMSKMAARATALRIDMNTTLGFAENLMDPDKAIEMANAFQRLGAGTSALLDPLKLMDLSMNDPAELQNQLVKMTQQYVKMNDETGHYEITNKRMFRELSKSLGLSYDELTKMALGGAELNEKLSKISFPDFIKPEQKELIANMAEMKGGEYVVRVQEGQQIKEKRITELSPENIDYLTKQPKTAEEMQKQALSTQESIAADVNAIKKAITGGVARSATAESLTQTARGISNTFEKFLSSQGLTPKSVGGGIDKVRTLLTGLITDDKKPLSEKLEEIFKNFEEGVKGQTNNMSNAMASLAEMLKQDPSIKEKDWGGKIDDVAKRFINHKDALFRDDGVHIPSENDLTLFIDKSKVKDMGDIGTVADQKENINPKLPVLETQSLTLIENLINKLTPRTETRSQETKGSENKTQLSGEVNVNINMSVSGVDSDLAEKLKIELAMKKGYLADTISQAVKDAINNNGMTGGINKGLPTG